MNPSAEFSSLGGKFKSIFKNNECRRWKDRRVPWEDGDKETTGTAASVPGKLDSLQTAQRWLVF